MLRTNRKTNGRRWSRRRRSTAITTTAIVASIIIIDHHRVLKARGVGRDVVEEAEPGAEPGAVARAHPTPAANALAHPHAHPRTVARVARVVRAHEVLRHEEAALRGEEGGNAGRKTAAWGGVGDIRAPSPPWEEKKHGAETSGARAGAGVRVHAASPPKRGGRRPRGL